MENIKPKVSVIIPCYNHGKYIEASVNSILNQTFQDFEIIIINDGSTDEYTNDVLKNFTKPKTIIINIENKGPSIARNTAIKSAKGEYILSLDADDYFENTFLEKSVKILDEKKEIGVVTCWYKSFNKNRFSISYPKGGGIENFLVTNNGCSASLFRKECWEDTNGYNPNMKDGYEDWDFWISITEKGWLVFIIEEVLFNYRVLKTGRDFKANKKRPELIRQIMNNHRDTYIKYMDQVIYEKEKEHLLIYENKSYKLAKYFSSIIKKIVKPNSLF